MSLSRRQEEATREPRQENTYRPCSILCFPEPGENTRVCCHDAYSQPYFGAWRREAPMRQRKELLSTLCHDGRGEMPAAEGQLRSKMQKTRGCRLVEKLPEALRTSVMGSLNGSTCPFRNLTHIPAFASVVCQSLGRDSRGLFCRSMVLFLSMIGNLSCTDEARSISPNLVIMQKYGRKLENPNSNPKPNNRHQPLDIDISNSRDPKSPRYRNRLHRH